MSELTDFYSGLGKDSAGRTYAELVTMPLDEMEVTHDYIQWLFPLREKSNFNFDAPVLTDEDVELFKSNSQINYHLNLAFDKILMFFGVVRLGTINECQFFKGPNYEAQKNVIFGKFNHNHLRVTRVLACLSICGLRPWAEAFLKFLKQNCTISDNTLKYWEDAVTKD